MSYRGTRFNWTGAFAPQTVGGRRAHPPKADKQTAIKINDKERRKAIRSAMAATMDKDLVSARGHKTPETYPFIITDDFEQLKKTKDLEQALRDIGLADDLARAENRKVRAGRGTMRGRKYKRATSILIVTSDDCPLLNAADNIPGVEATKVDELNAEILAPGAAPGRMTLYTQAAIDRLGKDKLFTEQRAKQAKKPSEEEAPAKKPAPKQAKQAKHADAPKAAAKPEVSA